MSISIPTLSPHEYFPRVPNKRVFRGCINILVLSSAKKKKETHSHSVHVTILACNARVIRESLPLRSIFPGYLLGCIRKYRRRENEPVNKPFPSSPTEWHGCFCNHVTIFRGNLHGRVSSHIHPRVFPTRFESLNRRCRATEEKWNGSMFRIRGMEVIFRRAFLFFWLEDRAKDRGTRVDSRDCFFFFQKIRGRYAILRYFY